MAQLNLEILAAAAVDRERERVWVIQALKRRAIARRAAQVRWNRERAETISEIWAKMYHIPWDVMIEKWSKGE